MGAFIATTIAVAGISEMAGEKKRNVPVIWVTKYSLFEVALDRLILKF